MVRVHSHYTREKNKREYLEHGLSIRKLYKMYREWATGKDFNRAASMRQYRDVFNTEYNIGFFQAKERPVRFVREVEKGHQRGETVNGT